MKTLITIAFALVLCVLAFSQIGQSDSQAAQSANTNSTAVDQTILKDKNVDVIPQTDSKPNEFPNKLPSHANEGIQIKPRSDTTTSPAAIGDTGMFTPEEVHVLKQQQGEQRENNLSQTQLDFDKKWDLTAQYSTSTGRAYRADDLGSALNSTKQDLLNNLEGPEMAPLRAYVLSHFPQPPPGMDTGENHGRVVPLVEAQKFRKDVDRFIAKVKSASVSSVDLEIVTVPSGAKVVLSVSDGAPDRETVSDGSIGNLYRGRYSYLITKSGYKNALGPLDLVDNPGIVLECKMAEVADSANSSQCVQK